MLCHRRSIPFFFFGPYSGLSFYSRAWFSLRILHFSLLSLIFLFSSYYNKPHGSRNAVSCVSWLVPLPRKPSFFSGTVMVPSRLNRGPYNARHLLHPEQDLPPPSHLFLFKGLPPFFVYGSFLLVPLTQLPVRPSVQDLFVLPSRRGIDSIRGPLLSRGPFPFRLPRYNARGPQTTALLPHFKSRPPQGDQKRRSYPQNS